MSEVTIPEKLAGVELVQSVRTPVRLTYDYIPGRAAQNYLRAMADKQILGQRCPVDGAVYVPPRGVCPMHGVATDEYVELPDHGRLGSFCITRVPIPGRDDLELPYVSGWVFLDGADIGFLGLVTGIDPGQVRIGMRIQAVWKPDDQLEMSAANVLSWEPESGGQT